jgi:hypothetical protein
MRRFEPFLRLTLPAACCVLLSGHALAADINGVWASDASLCAKIFTRHGGSVVLAESADQYGSGFVIDGRKIRAKIASCNIKTIKEDGPLVHVLAMCATDVMMSDVQLSLRVVDNNKVVRIFPGLPDIEMGYERCEMK